MQMLVEAFPFKKNCGLRYCRKNLYTYILNVKIVGQICPTLFPFNLRVESRLTRGRLSQILIHLNLKVVAHLNPYNSDLSPIFIYQPVGRVKI
jgi:hypothetical protein